MKKILGLLILYVSLFIFSSVCFASVMPNTTEEIPSASIGLYQVDKRLTVYQKPDINSKIVLDKEMIYSDYVSATSDNIFAVVLPNKEISYVYVLDLSEDENWVQVLIDKKGLKKGWVYKNDDFQFMPWLSFINLYGRKYGLTVLRNSSQNNKIYSQPDENAQILGQLNRPRFIRLAGVEGNWVLVSVLDISSETVTGYIQWRNEKGLIYLFPNIR